MAVVFALGAGLSFGTADFVGGLAAKRSPATTVTVLSQVAGFAVLLGRPAVPAGPSLDAGPRAGCLRGHRREPRPGRLPPGPRHRPDGPRRPDHLGLRRHPPRRGRPGGGRAPVDHRHRRPRARPGGHRHRGRWRWADPSGRGDRSPAGRDRRPHDRDLPRPARPHPGRFRPVAAGRRPSGFADDAGDVGLRHPGRPAQPGEPAADRGLRGHGHGGQRALPVGHPGRAADHHLAAGVPVARWSSCCWPARSWPNASTGPRSPPSPSASSPSPPSPSADGATEPGAAVG